MLDVANEGCIVLRCQQTFGLEECGWQVQVFRCCTFMCRVAICDDLSWILQDRELLQKLKQRLFDLYYEGKLQAWVDPAQFKGVEGVTNAMEFMLSGQALGKVVISF